MGRKVISFWLSLTLLTCFVIIVDTNLDVISNVSGNTLYVNETGIGAFDRIQDAINASNDGDTVFIYSGTYYEHVIVNKSISLTGEDKDTTIIDGGGSGDVVTIVVDWVNVTGLTVMGSGTGAFDAGLELSYVRKCEINNNIFTLNNYIGILLYYSDECNIIDNSASSNTFYGIRVFYSNSNHFIGNTLSNNKLGIGLTYSDYNDITNNTADSNDSQGIQLYKSNWNNVTGNQATNNPEYYGIYVSQSSDNYIIGNTASLSDVGIEVSQSTRIKIINNTVFDNVHHGIALGTSPYAVLINNTVSDNMWGIHCGGSNGTLMKDNIVTLSSWYGIALSFSSFCNLTNNTLINDGIYFRGNHVDYWNTHHIDESNSQNGKSIYYLKNQTGVVVPSGKGQYILANCSNIRMENITISGLGLPVQLGFCSHVEIINNTFSANKYFNLRLEYSNENKILNNTVTDNTYDVFKIDYSDNNHISGNKFSSNDYPCIELYYAKNNLISKNILTQNTLFSWGIQLLRSDYNRIIENIFLDTVGGIVLDYCDYNVIMGNILNNSGYINLEDSWRNTITYNKISNAYYGIYLTYSSNNEIYHNNIINNTNQAHDSKGTDNKWDNGYPGGGNYWSDYVGIDLNHTPSQDIPPSDGIGDSPYVIDADSQDNYPLMEPIENYTILKQGWNLISIPLIQEDQNLIKVLEMIDGYYATVEWYNISDAIDPWKIYDVNKPFGTDLAKINESIGFWIYITPSKGAVLLHNGTQPAVNQTITLHPGWNMVGYPSLTSYNRTIGLNNLVFDTNLDSIWTFNAASDGWKELGPSDHFEVGRGYWIHAKTKCVWEVPL